MSGRVGRALAASRSGSRAGSWSLPFARADIACLDSRNEWQYAHRLHHVRKGLFHAAEVVEAADKDQDNDGNRDGEQRARAFCLPSSAQRKPSTTPAIGFKP